MVRDRVLFGVMNAFTPLGSALFTAGGIAMAVGGDRFGWFVAAFFGLCLLVSLVQPWLPRHDVSSGYRLVIMPDEVACEHPRRPREAIRWVDVTRIWHVTTSDGPRLPDEWILLEGESRGCSFPTEAIGFDGIWDELEHRFAGFDYGPLIHGGTDDARHLCWERGRAT